MARTLPFAKEAEEAVIGSVMIDPEAFAEVSKLITSDDFFHDAHRIIFAAMEKLAKAEMPIDFITLPDLLEEQGNLEEIGGGSYLSSLLHMVPSSGSAKHYAGLIQKTSLQRQVIYACGTISALAYKGDDALLEKAIALFSKMNKLATEASFEQAGSIMAKYMNKLEKLAHGQMIGLQTGLTDFDRSTGGLQKGDLIIIAARPGVGKSSLALGIGQQVACAGHSVVLVSMEMSKEQVIQRLYSRETGIPLPTFRLGKRLEEQEWEEVVLARDKYEAKNFLINDRGIGDIDQLVSMVRRIHAEDGLDLLIVDYLQLLGSKTNGRSTENRVQEVSQITRGLKALALELEIPIIALSQLSRQVESRNPKIPQLSDLRDSGSVEQDADIVLFIYREDVYNIGQDPTGDAHIILAKHRNGPVGESLLFFLGETASFYNSFEEAESFFNGLPAYRDARYGGGPRIVSSSISLFIEEEGDDD